MRASVLERPRWVVAAIVLVIALAACERGTPFQPQAVDELKEGPGLFTGEAGRFVIYPRGRAGD